MKKLVIVLTVFVFMGFGLAFSPGVWADPITGTPSTPTPSWSPASTNALNYAAGNLPYVIFVGNDVGEVTLEFHNGYVGLVKFEYRVDGNVLTSGDAHWVIPGEFKYSGIGVGSPWYPVGPLTVPFTADEMVEVRLAVGGESNWRFDWVAFEALPPTATPEPATMLLLGLGLMGIAGIRRKFKG